MSDIDLDKLQKLMGMMLENDITELEYQEGELKIELRRGGQVAQAPAVAMAPQTIQAPIAAPAAAEPPAVHDELEGLVPIVSPMVGTYYASADPDSPPFVKVGADVSADTTVCLIEAMKVFNEIKAEVEGTIAKVAVGNAEAVEYGQPLYYVRPR